MATRPDGLVRITSAAELKPGLPVYEEGCAECRADHWEFLVRIKHDETMGCRDTHRLTPCPPEVSWIVIGCRAEWVCMQESLAAGRLFRFDYNQMLLKDISRSLRASTR